MIGQEIGCGDKFTAPKMLFFVIGHWFMILKIVEYWLSDIFSI